jgi:hypothetical protein
MHARLHPSRLLSCQLVHNEDGSTLTGFVENLSARGMALHVQRRLLAGDRVQVLLVNAGATFSLQLVLKVLRCERMPSGEYLLGGQFERTLSPNELMPFLV